MLTNIEQDNLRSKFFASLVEVECPIPDLSDGVVYVRTNNEEKWVKAVGDVHDSLHNARIMSSWLMPYDMKVLPDNVSSITDIMPEDQNIIMPVFVPDSLAQYYLVGKVDDESNLDSAFGFLTLDAQNILTESLPRAFSFIDSESVDKIFQNVGNPLIADAWADAVDLMRSSIRVSPSFRGVVAANPMSFLGDSAERAYEKVHNGEFSYKERASKIKELPSAAKKMRSEDKSVQEEAYKDFSIAWGSLSPHEQVRLVNEMMKEIKPIVMKRIISSVDRESLGTKTMYKVVIRPWESKFKKYGFDDNFKKCIFIKDGEQLYPLKMAKNSMVIYAMSLIERANKNNKFSIVDIKKNNKAFADIYKLLFDFNETHVQKQYDELFHRYKNNPDVPTRSGRLPENYNDIECALASTFKHLEEDYSPFLANASTPLAIIPTKIELTDDLKAIKIH